MKERVARHVLEFNFGGAVLTAVILSSAPSTQAQAQESDHAGGIVLKAAENISRLYPRMDGPNVYAVGTRVEAFRAGELDQIGAMPILVDEARPDGSPIHLGLGDADTFDLRMTFPGRPAVELKNVAAATRLFITPQGASPSDHFRRDP